MDDELPSPITLEFLARQQLRILEELAKVRDEQANARADRMVDSAIIQRLDVTVGGYTNEVRVLHGQILRVLRRLEKVETP